MRCWQCGSTIHGRKNQMFCNSRCRYRYYHNNDLVLILKKQWFDMILNGIKTEEYREIKPYWTKRFSNYFGQHYDFSGEESEIVWDTQKKIVVFRNGYGKDKPEFSAECTIREGYGKEAWGAEKDVKYYILTIHRVFGVKNVTEAELCELEEKGEIQDPWDRWDGKYPFCGSENVISF